MALNSTISNQQVWIVSDPGLQYRKRIKAPIEFEGDFSVPEIILFVRQLFLNAGLDRDHFDTPAWNPLSELISAGDKVVLKPNWVLHENQAAGLDCLITHTDVLEAVLHYLVKAEPGQITIGDAPIQRCDFSSLIKNAELDHLVSSFETMGYPIQLEDFRLTKIDQIFDTKKVNEPDPEKHILFTLDERSWLTPITKENTEFRVTNYDPDILGTHHYPGSHSYLIAKQIIDADVLINLPKLKAHKKAGITGALKNMVGINGFKEYLPHHRKGGSAAGGDCYQGSSWLKTAAENELDRANRAETVFSRKLHFYLAGLAQRFSRDKNLDGSWYGNDTVWRMVLDIQRILHYGDSQGSLSNTQQRTVLTITDAVLAGEGEGPLRPAPVELGIMSLGFNVSALDLTHAHLMGFDPEKMPVITNAFKPMSWPLVDFSPSQVQVSLNGKILSGLEELDRYGQDFAPPKGWIGHLEKTSNCREEL